MLLVSINVQMARRPAKVRFVWHHLSEDLREDNDTVITSVELEPQMLNEL